jgi:argininosuccinate lyase
MMTIHNTPFGDIVDTEDDLQPLVVATFSDATRAVRLVAAAMETATFDVARMAQRAEQGWITVTELADTLTREHQLPFKTSHAVASSLVTESQRQPDEPLESLLERITADVCGRAIRYSPERLKEILSPWHFVRVRRTPGGPAPDETTAAIHASRERLASDQMWHQAAVQRLQTAESSLKKALAEI